MAENRNFIIAAILSIGVLLVWQLLVIDPRMQEEQARIERESAQQQVTTGGDIPAIEDHVPNLPADVGDKIARDDAMAASPRLAVDTPSVDGSIALRGARFDDLSLKNYHETVDPGSPEIVLFSPQDSAHAYFAEFGWTAIAASGLTLPNKDTLWQVESGSTLTPETPVTLRYDNGAGLIFRRTISVGHDYLFTMTQSVENRTDAAVTLFAYGLVSRAGTPETQSFYILHEGLIGAFDEDGLQEIDYDDVAEDGAQKFSATKGWLGITDKYWAAVLVPPGEGKFTARYSEHPDPGREIYRADYLMDGTTIAPGASAEVTSRLFAGAKVVSIVDRYEAEQGIYKFDLLIDWGYLYFLTKPLFIGIDMIARFVGNFGIAILIMTVLIKLVFFPLANRSYVAMSKMKKLQPEMLHLRERHKDDRMKQQQELMALYKKEKVNPLAGCLPVLIQIPVFFALYKVLFVTIEMRHAPFFGWIQDLSAPDPTSLFNLFGLIPWDPPSFLMLGIWPIIMGFSMFVQMRMNPAPADPIQQQVFAWMPVFFTFLLASFPAGLVIYWAWNNTLSVLQQGVIMRRQGVPIELFSNLNLGVGKFLVGKFSRNQKPGSDADGEGS